MKTDITLRSFEPEAPLMLPVSVIRRLLYGGGMVVVALFVIWATMGSMTQPAPNPGITPDGWQRYETSALSFSYPSEWTISMPAEGEATGYRLAPAGVEAGTHVAIASLPAASMDLAQIERLGVAYVERNDAVARHYLRIMSRMRLADRVAARVRFTADLVSGERVEGLWIGVPQSDGRVLTFVLNVYPDDYFNGVRHTFKRLLTSVMLEG